VIQIQGMVAGTKDGTYTSKRDGKQIAQLNIDIYDKNCGVVPCQIGGAAVLPPADGARIVADVLAIRKINFGVGYVLTIGNIRPDDAPGTPPPPPAPPAPGRVGR
jgi:hypothetical protein